MTTHRSDFELDRPGTLIAALPAVLGFVPEKSLVLVSIDGGEMGAVMRVDLSADLAERVGQLAEVAAAASPEAAIAVIVDADGARCPVCADEYRELCTALNDALSQRDIVLWAAHVVDRVAAGGRWRCVDGCGSAGVVDDPSSSPLAVAAVLDGRRLYARRADLQAVIAVDDTADSAELAAAIAEQSASREQAQRGDPDATARRDIKELVDAAARVADAHQLSILELARLGCALSDVQVRDTMYALAIGVDAAAAECLWAVLSRSLPNPGGSKRWCCWRSVPTPAATAPGRRVAGGGTALRTRPPDGGHARPGVAVRSAARADSRTGAYRLPAGRAARRAAAAASIRSARGVTVRPFRP
ncbi:hypothetical protein I553_1466 [Mycobacterium xenopi 4042]|uniref:DUF4192 family protein n=1 Tax=Mycobacterium xenopi 4042 TaxID=1299334 RepID=X8CEJ7_MYCXE|nr:hypothetical protein I553_1466 [Mycobacterium xenopi 4042]